MSNNKVSKSNSLAEKNQKVARVVRKRSRYLYEVETTEKYSLLMVIPKILRETIWIRVGDFVIVEHVQEDNQVAVQIVEVLDIEQTWAYNIHNIWPKEFTMCLSCLYLKSKMWNSQSEDGASTSSSNDDDSVSASSSESDGNSSSGSCSVSNSQSVNDVATGYDSDSDSDDDNDSDDSETTESCESDCYYSGDSEGDSSDSREI